MQTMAFLLVPGFSAMAFFAALEPLRIANRLAARPLYRWSIHAPAGDHALASNGMQLRTDGPLPDRPEALIVCAGFDPLLAAGPGLLGQVRRLWRAGCQVGAIDTGAFVLAEAGILGRETITLHWEAAEEFRRRYPRIPVSTELYERHARLFTCAGGTAAMDMMLDTIAHSHGIALASAVSQQLIHDAIRPPSAPQRATRAEQAGAAGAVVQRLIAAMERRLGEGAALEAILADEGISRRQAERLFRARLGTSPGHFLRDLRLRHAIGLMRDARMPVHEAALAAGFSSQPVFSRACRQHFGQSPRELVSGPGLVEA
ncbi:MAG TPA: helix-turn-helix domain-containing protein [Novosphingobium sp.]|nr:helix-turn-helix domain-containing protein [Novosphingobium sp.]